MSPTTWIRSWSAAPQPVDEEFPKLSGATLRQQVRLSSGGRRIRVRFTNEFGRAGLTIGRARVSVAGVVGSEGILRGHDLTFGGHPSLFVPAGAPALSDPVELDVPAQTTLIVSLYLPDEVPEVTGHNFIAGPSWIIPGDQTQATGLPATAERLGSRALLSGIDVLAPGSTPGIVAIGASVTDGAGATNAAGGGWPEQLAIRFAAADLPVAVANQGISGNRLLSDGFGTSILARLDRDALSSPGLTHLVLLAGMNDIMNPAAPVGAEAAIAAYRQVIARAHGVKVLGATLTPFGGSETYTSVGDATRQQLNDWIRTSGAFHAVLDFDAAWRDPLDPTRILPDFDHGDHLHGNDAGYRALAASIDLGLFAEKPFA